MWLEIKPKNYLIVPNSKLWVLKKNYNIKNIQYEKVVTWKKMEKFQKTEQKYFLKVEQWNTRNQVIFLSSTTSLMYK